MKESRATRFAVRFGAIVLAVVMAVTYMPLMGLDYAHADGEEGGQYRDVKASPEEMKKLGLKEGETVVISDDDERNVQAQEEALQKIAEKDGGILLDDDEAASDEGGMSLDSAGTGEAAKTEDAEEAVIETEAEMPEIQATHVLDGQAQSSDKGLSLNQYNPSYITVSKPNAYGYVTLNINGSNWNAGYSVREIDMDNTELYYDSTGQRPRVFSNETIDMKYFDVGYHTLYVYYNYNGSAVTSFCDAVTYIPTYFYGAPSNSINDYTTTVKRVGRTGGYFSYNSGHNSEYVDVYMQYKKAKKKSKWSKTLYKLGTSSYTTYNIPKKLKANTKYCVRLLYIKHFEYGGRGWNFYSSWTGRYSSTKKMYTAMNKKQLKKKIKKISIKAKVKSYKYLKTTKVTAYWWGWREHYKTAKGYYTIYTPTVRFKKKPKLAGIYLKTKYGTDWKGGNKKKYSVKFYERGRKKRKKFKISVKAVKSSKYLGRSPWYAKRVRSH